MRCCALVFVTVCLILSGCSNLPDSFAITFVNDTGHRVVLNLCDDDACHSYDYSDKVQIDGSVPENIDPDHVFTRWAVTTPAGQRLGCLPFEFSDAWGNAVAYLSQMVPCPGHTPLQLAKGTPLHEN